MIRPVQLLSPVATLISASIFLASSALVSACKKSDEPKPEAEPVATAETEETAAKPEASAKKKPKVDNKALAERRKALKERLAKKKLEAKPVAKVPVSKGDPENGEFTLDEATKGLPKDGVLVAEIVTDAGTLSCDLYEDRAPISVANFVGLARGIRPWEKDGKWIKKPLYDGTTFHRIIKGFMIQGGDPAGNGSGGPGFVVPDEIWVNATHDRRGLLCMANRGPNTNGSQFFILDGSAPHLDGGYTVFGECSPEEVIEKLSNTEVKGDRAVKPPKIKKVTVKRDKSRPRPEAKTEGQATGPAKELKDTKAQEAPANTAKATPSAPPKAAPKPQGT